MPDYTKLQPDLINGTTRAIHSHTQAVKVALAFVKSVSVDFATLHPDWQGELLRLQRLVNELKRSVDDVVSG